MKTISLCMIVKDEEEVLERCLRPVRPFVEEIIIADTGSKDSTKVIAAGYADQVYSFPWNDDFAAARNFAFSKASMDYCMWLDADDVMTQENLEKLKIWKNQEDRADVVMMKYLTGVDEKGRPSLSYYRERLLKNHSGFWWKGKVHEAIPLAGTIQYTDMEVLHQKVKKGDPDRNLRIYENMRKEGGLQEPREWFYYGRELYDHQNYSRALEVLHHFQEMPGAWLENKIESCLQAAACQEALGNETEAMGELVRSFLWSAPRAEICCEIGRLWMKQKQWKNAAAWYQQALRDTRSLQSGAFIREDCRGFLPAIQVCVCYDHMGSRKRAYGYHCLAKKFRPDSEWVLYNDRYFSDTN